MSFARGARAMREAKAREEEEARAEGLLRRYVSLRCVLRDARSVNGTGRLIDFPTQGGLANWCGVGTPTVRRWMENGVPRGRARAVINYLKLMKVDLPDVFK